MTSPTYQTSEGGFVLGSKIAPIFFNTMEDAGAMPIEVDVNGMEMGDVIDVYPHAGKVCKHGTDEVLGEFEHKTEVLMNEVRANGRIPLIIGRGLTDRAREALGLGPTDVFTRPVRRRSRARATRWRKRWLARPVVSTVSAPVNTASP